jgi:inner membrane protein
MASAISHAVAALAIGAALRPVPASPRFWVLGITCAIVPDVDVAGFSLGVPYGSILGHRGLTHSLAFAAALSGLVVATWFRDRRWNGYRRRLLLYFFVVAASHGALDALTNGGLGVAFFAPFNRTRYFFPFRPIVVSPLSLRAFFSDRGVAVLASEIRWIWLPSLLLIALAIAARRRSRTSG